MQRCIMDIREWMLSDRLKLNDDKTGFVLIGSRQQLAKVNIDALHVGDCVTPLSSAVKNLGSWFDEQLKMDKHINSICKATFFHLYNIRKIRKFLSSDCTHGLWKMHSSLAALTTAIVSCLDCLATNYISLNVFRTQPRGLFVMLEGLNTLLLLYSVFIGYLLPTELSSKFCF